jgi:uncharacterized protein YprB with RNaseH-like and TPR domain
LTDCTEAYLDIETTGLTPVGCDITVVGMHLCNGNSAECVQLVGREITSYGILETLEGVDIIYTYNGSRFDLPFIHARLGLDLEGLFAHRDLMYDCWRYNLRGGLKAVERQLGISRDVQGVDGYEAVRLWWRYVDSFDLDALDTLLAYNKEDVVNLKTLKELLL